MKDLLEQNKAIVLFGRKVGNTTRQIDFAVQQLFITGYVQFIDHSAPVDRDQYPKPIPGQTMAFETLLERLKREHGIDIKADLVIDKVKFKIRFNEKILKRHYSNSPITYETIT